MGFDFGSFLAQFSVALIVLIFAVSINFSEINGLISGINLENPQLVKLAVNILVFFFISGVFLISSVKKNVLKIINMPLEYVVKLMDRFMK